MQPQVPTGLMLIKPIPDMLGFSSRDETPQHIIQYVTLIFVISAV